MVRGSFDGRILRLMEVEVVEESEGGKPIMGIFIWLCSCEFEVLMMSFTVYVW